MPRERRRLSKTDVVSTGALLLFRLIERLSKRGPGCVLKFPNLAAMLDKPSGGTYSERRTWDFWNELLKFGWIDYRVFRKSGKQYLEFWPLVRVREAGERIFLRQKTALRTAPSNPKNCTLAPRTIDSSELSEAKEDDGDAVAVSSPSAPSELLVEAMVLCEESDAAQALATAERELRKKGKSLTPGAVRQAVKAAKDWLARNAHVRPGQALTNALKVGWNPPAPPAQHPSDLGLRPTRIKEDPEKAAKLAAEKQAKETLEAAVESGWSGLSASDREARLKAALREVLESCSGIARDRVLKAGTGHQQVIAVAKSRVRAELQGRAS